MKLRTEHHGSALIAKVGDRVNAGNARDFETAMNGVLDQAGGAVILDCGELRYISSAGLRVILQTTKRLDRRRVPFLVCSLSTSVSEVFRISGFDRIIPVCDTRAEALATLPR